MLRAWVPLFGAVFPVVHSSGVSFAGTRRFSARGSLIRTDPVVNTDDNKDPINHGHHMELHPKHETDLYRRPESAPDRQSLINSLQKQSARPFEKKSGVIGSETEILNTRPETLEPETSCTPQSPQHTKPFVHQKLYYAEPKHLAPETLQTWKPPSDAF